MRTAAIETLGKILRDFQNEKAGARAATAAIRAMLAASKINLDHVEVTIKANTHEKIRRELNAVQRRLDEQMRRVTPAVPCAIDARGDLNDLAQIREGEPPGEPLSGAARIRRRRTLP
jgi:hypothetical protein